jgi:hypothetical protein
MTPIESIRYVGMTSALDDLAAIRRLSQYRPFERGGASAVEAKQDLVLAALAEAGGSCQSVSECADSIETLWGLSFNHLELAQAINGLISDESLVRDKDGEFRLSTHEKQRLEAHAELARANATRALDDWHVRLVDRYPSLTSNELEVLDADLQAFLTRVVHRHGAEAALLMYPDDDGARHLYESLEEEGFDFLGSASLAARQRREWALSQFVRRPTDSQKAFLAAALTCAFYTTVLTIDPQAARVVRQTATGQRIYLDTNFLYRLLGVQGPRYITPAETILRTTQAAGYVCAVTPWTIAEFRTSLARSKGFLERYPLPPDEFAALAADATSDEDFVTSYWRQAKSTRVTVEDYVAYHSEVEAHLAARGIALVTEGVTAVEQQEHRIEEEIVVLERVLHGRNRHPELLAHDVKHRLLVSRLRGAGNRTFANAGYWFLTHDTVLPRYDYKSSGHNATLPFCVSTSSWYQVVEAFRPKTEDMEQTLADILASPYIRPRRTIGKQSAQAVVARVALYKDGTPQLAARVFMNSAAMHEIDTASSSEEQEEKIEKAIVAAAKEAQADARAAAEAAVAERLRAEEATHAASERVKEAERRGADEIARAEALSGEAIKNEEARAAEALQAERRRSEDALAFEREMHRAEMETQEQQRRNAEGRAARLRRRLVLLATAVIATVTFLLIGLFAGLEHAWAYIVGAGVIVGLAAGTDQLLLKRSVEGEHG